ncbi:hypothetical protein Scep_022022 [Stephania cephalantha]|uniref:Protein DA1-like domain-containing protein n=1 Tax=Stephania cephalantha TaxID=152367 RepID=A0AAP0HXC1_9MAGN
MRLPSRSMHGQKFSGTEITLCTYESINNLVDGFTCFLQKVQHASLVFGSVSRVVEGNRWMLCLEISYEHIMLCIHALLAITLPRGWHAVGGFHGTLVTYHWEMDEAYASNVWNVLLWTLEIANHWLPSHARDEGLMSFWRSRSVTSINKKPRVGGNILIGMKTQQQRLHRKCEVTAILVLYGIPRLLTGSILAHDLMHGWLRLKAMEDNLKISQGNLELSCRSYSKGLGFLFPELSSMPNFLIASQFTGKH